MAELNRQAKNIFYTCPMTEENYLFLSTLTENRDWVRYTRGQIERGMELTPENPEGYLHIQGYIQVMESGLRMGTLKNRLTAMHQDMDRMNLRVAEDPVVAKVYVWCEVGEVYGRGHVKTGLVVPDRRQFESGTWVAIGSEKTTYERAKRVLDEAGSHQEAMEALVDMPGGFSLFCRHSNSLPVYSRTLGKRARAEANLAIPVRHSLFLHGKSEVGKTTLAKSLLKFWNPREVWETDQLEWFDGAEGSKVWLVDEFDGGFCRANKLKGLMDKFTGQLQVKGGFIPFPKLEMIIFTSNVDMREIYPNISQVHMDALINRLSPPRGLRMQLLNYDVGMIERAENGIWPRELVATLEWGCVQRFIAAETA